jgi:hypothetical protein
MSYVISRNMSHSVIQFVCRFVSVYRTTSHHVIWHGISHRMNRHVISFHIICWQVISSIKSCFIMVRRISICHYMSCHILVSRISICHDMSCHIVVSRISICDDMSCHIMVSRISICHDMSCYITVRLISICHDMSCYITVRLISICHDMSCHIMVSRMYSHITSFHVYGITKIVFTVFGMNSRHFQ